MAKFIIDIQEKGMVYLNVWKCEDGKCVWTDSYTTSDLRPYTASESYLDGLKKGQNDAWEFAKTVSIMKPEDKRECWGTDKYNTINLGYSYQEAKAKYEAWQKQKDEIRVGDEVVYADDPNKEKAIVLRLYQPKQYRALADILCEDGIVVKMIKVENLAWTGRHFPEVAELLKKMRESDD